MKAPPNTGVTIYPVSRCDDCGEMRFQVHERIVCGPRRAAIAAFITEKELNLAPNITDSHIMFDVITFDIPDDGPLRKEYPFIVSPHATMRLYSDVHKRTIGFGAPAFVEKRENACLNDWFPMHY